MTHTADTCEVSTHDHFGQRQAFENGTGREPLPDSDELLCGDCERRIYYDYGQPERYRHLTEPERGCFLIPSEASE